MKFSPKKYIYLGISNSSKPTSSGVVEETHSQFSTSFFSETSRRLFLFLLFSLFLIIIFSASCVHKTRLWRCAAITWNTGEQKKQQNDCFAHRLLLKDISKVQCINFLLSIRRNYCSLSHIMRWRRRLKNHCFLIPNIKTFTKIQIQLLIFPIFLITEFSMHARRA